MSIDLILRELRRLNSGALLAVSHRARFRALLDAPALVQGRLGSREVIEKILPPHRGSAMAWTNQQADKPSAIVLLHRGRCPETAWFEAGLALATVGNLVLLDLDVDGTEAGTQAKLDELMRAMDEPTRDEALATRTGVIGPGGLIMAPEV